MARAIKKFDLVTIGGITADILFYSKEGELINTGDITKQKLLAFEYGAKIMADKVFFTYGGGANNVAVGAAKLGLKSALIGAIGNDDNGKNLMKNLLQNKVESSLVKIDAKASTGFSVILTMHNAAKEHVAFLYRGTNNDLTVNDLMMDKINTAWFYLGALPAKNWEPIVSLIVKSNKKIIWNPGHQQLIQLGQMKKFLPAIDVLVLNRDEALEFKKLKDIKGLIKYIYQLGPKLVVITDGAKGVYAFDGKKYYFLKAKTVKAINTIGVGDAFCSGLTSALVYGKNIRQALDWGIKNSAAVVAEIGAQKGLLNRRQIG